MQPNPPRKHPPTWPIFLGVTSLVLVGLVATEFWVGDFKLPAIAAPPSAYVADETDAKIVCKQFVADRLRAPASASFAPYSAQKASITGGTFSVHGYVDSQNGFAANIRTTYDCAVKPPATRDGDWSLVSLTTSP